MHGNTTQVWPGMYTTATTAAVLGKIVGGSKVRKVLHTPLQNGERGDTGIPGIPDTVQYHSGCSSQGDLSVDLWNPGGSIWVQMVGGEKNICFYADDGQIAGRDLIWVQEALTTTVRIFERVGLQKELDKTKAMICTPGFIWGQHGYEA